MSAPSGHRQADDFAVAKPISAPIKGFIQTDTMLAPKPGADMRRREFLGIVGSAAATCPGGSMRRRNFIAVIGGLVVAPFAARPQKAMPVVGTIASGAAGRRLDNG